MIKLMIITLHLFRRKNFVIYMSLVSLIIFIIIVLIRLKKALILIIISTPSLRNKFLIIVSLISFYTIRANSILDSNEYFTAATF
jgi:hypothetical protein